MLQLVWPSKSALCSCVLARTKSKRNGIREGIRPLASEDARPVTSWLAVFQFDRPSVPSCGFVSCQAGVSTTVVSVLASFGKAASRSGDKSPSELQRRLRLASVRAFASRCRHKPDELTRWPRFPMAMCGGRCPSSSPNWAKCPLSQVRSARLRSADSIGQPSQSFGHRAGYGDWRQRKLSSMAESLLPNVARTGITWR